MASGDVKERTTAELSSIVGSNVPLPGPEFCSAVVTGILGVHRGVLGRLRIAPPPQDRCPDQTLLFAVLQSDPGGGAEHEPLHGSKLRLRVTWARKTFPAWPEERRPPLTQPRHPDRSFATIASGVAMEAF